MPKKKKEKEESLTTSTSENKRNSTLGSPNSTNDASNVVVSDPINRAVDKDTMVERSWPRLRAGLPNWKKGKPIYRGGTF